MFNQGNENSMKLLYLANDFAIYENGTLIAISKVPDEPNPRYENEKPRYTPVLALLVLLVFAGFSLTIPLHPTRSAVPNGCSAAVALPPGESAADCILQATRDNSAKTAEKATKETTATSASTPTNNQVANLQFVLTEFSKVIWATLPTRQTLAASQL